GGWNDLGGGPWGVLRRRAEAAHGHLGVRRRADTRGPAGERPPSCGRTSVGSASPGDVRPVEPRGGGGNRPPGRGLGRVEAFPPARFGAPLPLAPRVGPPDRS